MTRHPSRIRHVSRDRAFGYMAKAEEFYACMQQALQDQLWSGVGLNAVHCAISACDAVVVISQEQRSASSDHEEAAYLLASLQKVPEAKNKAETLRKIIHRKRMIEYEDRQLSASEAAELAKLTEHFYRWAQEQLRRVQ